MGDFTPEEKCSKIDVRCPYCSRLWFKAFVFETLKLVPLFAIAVEVRCPNCSKMVAWPVIALPED